MNQTRILFGCGYLGSRVAKLWRAMGNDVIATTRRETPSPDMIDAGVFPAWADVTQSDTLKWLQFAPALSGQPMETLLYAVGYDRGTGPDIHSVYAQGLANVLAAMPNTVKRVIYISTTGVYGAAGGDWVDELTPTDPQRDGGKASLAAEKVLRNHYIGKNSIILRLAGIYGPNRIPYIDKLRAGEPLAIPSEGWLNLIHVDDAATIVVALDQWAAEHTITDGPEVFCVSDGQPMIRGDYYREVARLVGASQPKFIAPHPDTPAVLRARADKRISTRKLVDTIRPTFLFPDYRAGLKAILGDLG
jgi:nucleoside-diphosphate-sugar epimerase